MNVTLNRKRQLKNHENTWGTNVQLTNKTKGTNSRHFRNHFIEDSTWHITWTEMHFSIWCSTPVLFRVINYWLIASIKYAPPKTHSGRDEKSRQNRDQREFIPYWTETSQRTCKLSLVLILPVISSSFPD